MALITLDGWSVSYTDGIPTIRLSIIDEGYITQPTDEPANAVFKPRILNPEQFSVATMGHFWPIDGDGRADGGAATYAPLRIFNPNGEFDALIGANLRDARLQIFMPPAQMLGDAESLKNLRPIITAVVNNIHGDDEDVITIEMRGVLATFDRTLPMRRFPPFVDSGVASRPLPFLYGACCGVSPPVVNGVDRIYQLSDGQVTNIVVVRDKGARLDPGASPPQYTPAVNSTCLQLQTSPEGKLTVDASSVGSQAPAPGVPDILAGAGLLTNWPNPANPPTGWSIVNAAYGSLARLDHTQAPQDYVASMMTTRRYSPSSGSFGYPLQYPANMQPGKTYEITFALHRTLGQYGAKIGLMVRSDLTANANGAISDYNNPLQQPNFQTQVYRYVYTCPPGAARPIYMIAVGDPTYSAAVVLWYGLRIRELGQYPEQPMLGGTLAGALHELLVVRDGQDPSVYSASDAEAVGGDVSIGRYYSEPPNIVEALQELADQFCATPIEDSDGVIRFARLGNPALGIPIADFDPSNIKRPVSIASCDAEYLTTRIGIQRNWSVDSDSDFVSDDVAVPLAMRQQRMRTSRIERTSTVTPSGHYAAARNAPVFHSLRYDESQGQAFINDVNALFAPETRYGREPFNGKRRIVKFTAVFDDPESVGVTMRASIRDLMVGRYILVTYPDRKLFGVVGQIIGRVLYAAAKEVMFYVFI